MAKRSLQASAEGIKALRKSLNYRGWTHKSLAEEVGLKTRQPVWRLLSGQPIERHAFIEICAVLDLDWLTIVEPDSVTVAMRHQSPEEDLDDEGYEEPPLRKSHGILVVQERSWNRCNTLHIKRPHCSVPLEAVFVDLEVTDSIQSRYLSQNAWAIDNLPKPLSTVILSHSKIRLLGSIGSGKTTLLKALALSAKESLGKIPLFISLRQLYQTPQSLQIHSLLDLLWVDFGLESSDASLFEEHLKAGDFLILLDDVDPLRDAWRVQVLQDLEVFCDRYFKNSIVLACRTADLSSALPNFTDFTIPPLSTKQQEDIVKKWFTHLYSQEVAFFQRTLEQLIQALQTEPQPWVREMMHNPDCLVQRCFFAPRERPTMTESENGLAEYCLHYLRQKVRDVLDQSPAASSQIASGAFDDSTTLKALKKNALGHLATYLKRTQSPVLKQEVAISLVTEQVMVFADKAGDRDLAKQKSEALLQELVIQDGLLAEAYPDTYRFPYEGFQTYFEEFST